MSVETLPLLIMTGVTEGSEPERMVSQTRQAITLDLVERALTVPSLKPVIVATNSPALARRLAGYPILGGGCNVVIQRGPAPATPEPPKERTFTTIPILRQ